MSLIYHFLLIFINFIFCKKNFLMRKFAPLFQNSGENTGFLFPMLAGGTLLSCFQFHGLLLVMLGTLICLPKSMYHIAKEGNIAILLMSSSSA